MTSSEICMLFIQSMEFQLVIYVFERPIYIYYSKSLQQKKKKKTTNNLPQTNKNPKTKLNNPKPTKQKTITH